MNIQIEKEYSDDCVIWSLGRVTVNNGVKSLVKFEVHANVGFTEVNITNCLSASVLDKMKVNYLLKFGSDESNQKLTQNHGCDPFAQLIGGK